MTKMAHFVPTMEKTSAEEVVRLFWDNVWKLHGLPESIIIDRGAQFVARMMKELNQMLGIDTKLLTAYHPLKGAKGTISLEQANNAVLGPNCMLKSLCE